LCLRCGVDVPREPEGPAGCALAQQCGDNDKLGMDQVARPASGLVGWGSGREGI